MSGYAGAFRADRDLFSVRKANHFLKRLPALIAFVFVYGHSETTSPWIYTLPQYSIQSSSVKNYSEEQIFSCNP
jgi:hypothetical protein